MSDTDAHFNQLARWIELEGLAETERLAERRLRQNSTNAERTGETLLDMVIEEYESGLGGRFLLTLVKRNRTLKLPWNRLKAGSPVVLSPASDGDNQSFHGVVSARSQSSIQVAVDEWPDGERFRIDLTPDELTRRRQLAAMTNAASATGRLGQLRNILLQEREPRFTPEMPVEFSQTLNESQQQAVIFALSATDVAIIHGPPGTGKTTTVVELICQAIARGDKVLACAPSNTAVDNLVERLAAARQKVVRIGHPARVSEALRDLTLDAQVQSHEAMTIVRDMLRESEQLFRRAGRFTRARPAPGEKQDLRRQARELRSGARQMERLAVTHVLDRADVVCATLTCDEDILGDRRFDLVVIDEACQSTEPGCWIPLQYAERVVLAGDHFQLPPTVLSALAAREGLQTSLLERLARVYGETITRRLDVQYRMHQNIMEFSSRQFYDDTLVAHDSVAAHRLCDLPGIEESLLTIDPVLFIDTAGAGWSEELEPDGESRRNPSEGRLVLKKIDELQAAGLIPSDIAVIAPYAAQVRWLRDHCDLDGLEIDTVDGFQGREKEAVIITLVRSNETGEIGFLSDTRRMNVALTRARRKLIVIGDSATLASHDFYTALLEYMESIGAYHTVWEEDMDMPG